MKSVYGYALLTPRGQIGTGVETPLNVFDDLRLLFCIYPTLRAAKVAQRENFNSTIKRVKIEAAT